MRSIWQGLLSFSLINIPVKLFKATEDQDFHFSLLHNVCHNPLKYQRYCPYCEQVVELEQTVRGYEYEKERYVILSEKELEAAASPKTKTIEILAFLAQDAVDTIFYENAYYLQPGTGGEKAYRLLGTALNRQKKAALCRIVLRTTPKLCLVEVGDSVLSLSTIRYASEIRSSKTLGQIPTYEVNQAELELAELLITKLTKPFIPEQYPNTYRQAISELVEKKLSGQEVHIVQKTPEPQVANILEALQASLEKVERDGLPAYVR